MIKLISEIEAEQKASKNNTTQEEKKISSQKFPTPVYHAAIYPNLYTNEKWFNFFSQKWISNLITLYSRDEIIKACLEEIHVKAKVLQMGVSFGDEIRNVAEQVGLKGRLDVIDINNAQLTFAQEYLGDGYPQVNFYHYNAETPIPEKYDIIICYMLLHEVPIVSKTNIVNNALNSIAEGGKVIFVDYGRPNMLHPLAYCIRMFNRLYQPFAEKMWDREIASYAEKDLNYTWKKQRFLGGLYQKVVVTKKSRDQYIY